jgi:hypothetical protein
MNVLSEVSFERTIVASLRAPQAGAEQKNNTILRAITPGKPLFLAFLLPALYDDQKERQPIARQVIMYHPAIPSEVPVLNFLGDNPQPLVWIGFIIRDACEESEILRMSKRVRGVRAPDEASALGEFHNDGIMKE